jgi:hypothetical protein
MRIFGSSAFYSLSLFFLLTNLVKLYIHIRENYNIFVCSKIARLANWSLINMMLGILKLMHCLIDQKLELLFPTIIEFVKPSISTHTILRQCANKILTSFCILFSEESCRFSCLGTIFFWFFILYLSGRMRTKNGWCRQNLVKMLELLSCSLLIRVWNGLFIDLNNIWESIHNESAQQYSWGHFISLNWQRNQWGKRFKLGYLNKRINVVVLKVKRLQLAKPF